MTEHLGYQLESEFRPVALPRALTGLLRFFVSMPRFVSQGRLLDVGCGAGEKLLEFRNLGWQVKGADLSETAAKAGAQKELEIQTSFSPDTPPYPDSSFDAITFYHSLEHFPSPSGALKLAHRLMEENGQLVVVVPNFGSLERRIFGTDWGWMQIPLHFYHFNKASLAEMIRDAGFRVEYVGNSFAGQSIDKPTTGPLGPLSRLIMKFHSLFGMLTALLGSGKAIIIVATKVN